ncbi:MAG TPA: hypothetical protein DCE39_13980 [Planctomycetaceae bacterium]|nr:hypothetical protein [Planctomycetaceae bacterium]
MTKTREMDSEMIEKTPIRGWLLPGGALLLLLLIGTPPCVAADEPAVEKPAVPKTIVVRPAEVDLVGRRGVARLSVLGRGDGGRVTDLSRVAKYKIENPGVVAVTADGRLSAVADGQSRVTVAFGGQSQTITVRVKDFGVPDPVDFHSEVIAALSRGGCNQGACHGSPQGKNGFRLSLRGYKPELDRMTLTREIFGRRTSPQNPDASLILAKAANRMPHVGGRRFRGTEPAYGVLRQWIFEGTRVSENPESVVKMEVLPGQQTLHTSSPRLQLVARAHFADGSIRDVTHLAVFTTSDVDASSVSDDGLVTFHGTAEVAVLVRYLKQMVSVRLAYVRADPDFVADNRAEENAIDRLVFAKHRQLQLKASPAATDGTYLRRVHLDLLGVLPSPEAARAYLDSKDPKKHLALVDGLLKRSEFAEFWAMKWLDVMRGNRESITERGVHKLHRHLVRHFAEDRSFGELARQILTSRGNTIENPTASFFRIARTPEDAAESTAQLFLGVRIQCAKCHNHPFEAITQNDYYGLAAYFARVKLKGRVFGLDREIVYVGRAGEVKHAESGEVMKPTAFGKVARDVAVGQDVRPQLADWLVRSENRWFARSTVNRIWAHIFGLGIVEPVDDFRESNPPSNPELLNELARQFVEGNHRFKPVIRSIVTSQAYRLGARPVVQSRHSAAPARYVTSAVVKMLAAEQILDAISQATGVPEKYKGYPLGTRATQLAEGAVDHNFLKAFTKPVRDVRCDCARETDPTLNQVVHLINNAGILDRFDADSSRLGRMLSAKTPTVEIVETLYLATISRRPSPAERKLALGHVASLPDRAAGLRDIQHALINSNEFLLRH